MDDLMNFRAPAPVRNFTFASGSTFLGGFQQMVSPHTGCEDQVLDGPASGEQGSKGRN